jgi:hypothetical protein
MDSVVALGAFVLGPSRARTAEKGPFFDAPAVRKMAYRMCVPLLIFRRGQLPTLLNTKHGGWICHVGLLGLCNTGASKKQQSCPCNLMHSVSFFERTQWRFQYTPIAFIGQNYGVIRS